MFFVSFSPFPSFLPNIDCHRLCARYGPRYSRTPCYRSSSKINVVITYWWAAHVVCIHSVCWHTGLSLRSPVPTWPARSLPFSPSLHAPVSMCKASANLGRPGSRPTLSARSSESAQFSIAVFEHVSAGILVIHGCFVLSYWFISLCASQSSKLYSLGFRRLVPGWKITTITTLNASHSYQTSCSPLAEAGEDPKLTVIGPGELQLAQFLMVKSHLQNAMGATDYSSLGLRVYCHRFYLSFCWNPDCREMKVCGLCFSFESISSIECSIKYFFTNQYIAAPGCGEF